MLAALKEFDKNKLRPTETKVLTVDGRILSEKRDSYRRTTVTQLVSGEQGYIGDVRVDLHVGEILPGLIMGSQDVAHDADILEKYNVSHILNAASMVGNLYPDTIIYKNLKIRDVPEAKINEQFNDAHTFIEQGRQLGCVLVHCNAGVSRAATLVISYLMKFNKMSFSSAHEYLKARRPVIRPNDGFIQQLKDYEEVLLQLSG